MFINNDIKKQLEQLSNEEENKKCFDCGAQPARMVSLNNGIYLCHSCSEEHKKIEAETNIIKSITLEQWNKNQLNIMKKGGNMKLRIFLEQNNINTNIDKNILYNSKIMLYYRNKLKAEAEEKLLFENLPPRDEFLEPYNIEDNENGNSSNNLDLNELLNMNKNSNNHENNIINGNSGIIINDNQYLNDKIIDYPKNIITIDEDQYSLAKANKSLQKKSQNSIIKKDSLLDSINEEENEKYISVGSESNNINNNNSIFQNSGYFGTVGNIIHTVWDTGVQATTNVKEKMNEYTIGKGILYIGGKLVEGVVYIGGKIVHKAEEGISYITQRISRRGGSENNENNNYIDISDNINYDRDKNYKNINLSSDIENNYNIINEKNENLL